MTPTNPAAPPADSAQATPEALAIARKCMDVLYGAMRARGVITTMPYDFGIPPVAQAIDAATRELRQALGWISVDDQLPEYRSGDVIVCVEYPDGTRKVTLGEHDAMSGKCWWLFHQTGVGGLWRVTHWMKLPEPPERTAPR
jgi:hypothetical protein